jgi:hypothetical protein
MSLLHQETPEEVDGAAQGESYTKGSSHVVIAGIAATIVITIAVAIYVLAGQRPPAATGQILEVWAHPMHTVTSGFDASGASMPQETFDQVLVFTRVRLHNQSDKPLFMHQIMTNATLDDGIHTSYAAMPGDYQRIFVAYPDLAAWRGTPLSPETTIDAGQTAEGIIVSAFRLSKEQWDARKSLNYTFGFRYLPNLTLAPQIVVTEH